MGDLKLYFPDPEDHLRRWFKATYGDNASQILKDYIRKLYDTNGASVAAAAASEDDLNETTRAKLRAAFADVDDSGSERAWLVEMRYNRMNGADVARRRLADLKLHNPEIARLVDDAFCTVYPVLAQAGGMIP